MKKQSNLFNPINIGLGLMLFIVIWVSSNMNWGDNRWHKLLKIDGVGYHSYLPAIFIYEDLNFAFYDSIVQSKQRPELDFAYRMNTENGIVNKYYFGTALLSTPFFLTAHLISNYTGGNADGYSFYYLLGIQFAAFFYLLLGMIIMSSILKIYNVSSWNRIIVMFAILFGTNLFYYVVHEPFMSHVFSFCFMNMFVFSVLKYKISLNTRYLFLTAISLGLIFLIRPINLLVILSIPFFFVDLKSLMENLKTQYKNPINFILSIILFLGLVSIQFIIYKIQTGSFIVYSYKSEGFNFFDIQILNFLLSYRKGFFLWAPLCLFSLLGLFFIYKESKFQFAAWILFFLIITYFLSSWWSWWYGGSFGSRVMIDFMIFFAIPLALLLQKTKLRTLSISVIFVLILFTQIQTYQYVKGYIHWSKMNKDWYWDYFLRVDKVIDRANKPWETDMP